MRLTARLVIALAVLWSVWWAGWTAYVRIQVPAWFADRAASGWLAEFADIGSSGFPLVSRTRLDRPALADPATGVAWQADWLSLENPVHRPGRQTLRFPDTVQRLSYLDQTHTIRADGLVAMLDVAPLEGLALSAAEIVSGPWRSALQDRPGIIGTDLGLRIHQAGTPNLYRVRARVNAFRLEAQDTAGGQVAVSVPELPGSLTVDATIGFSRPWDVTAISAGRPQPVSVHLRLAEVKLGGLDIHAAGRLQIAPGGVANGEMTLKAENWREVLDRLAATGALGEPVIRAVRETLELLARFSGSRNALDVTVTFRDGRMSAGLIPLGPAPRFILH